jgi:8-amino-7-oxononanoate synthase
MMPNDPYIWIDRALDAIHRANWYRSPQAISAPGAVVEIQGQRLLNFASNDYLGLAGDRRLVEAAVAATRTYGTGTTGSRLITGHRPLHRELERAIADLKQTEDALVFSSGYLANLGTIAALVGKRDLILGDRYNHSSLKNGAILSGATAIDYPHAELPALRELLSQHRDQYRRCLLVTDSIFSMDGDLAPLTALLDLADEFSCMLLVDEAHATGVLGATGAGAIEACGGRERPSIQMGTLSKALGSLGGYVAGSRQAIDFLRNRAPTWIYTTGLSPADTAAAIAAIAIVRDEPERRARLWQNVASLKQGLERAGIEGVLPSDSPIICIQMRDAATVLEAGRLLKKAGILVAAVRPPTVPTSLLRLTVMASHTPEQCAALIDRLKVLKERGLG